MRSVFADTEVDPQRPLWRYLSTERFVATLRSRTLNFSAATQFEDPFEGAVAVLPHDWPVDPRYAEPELGERAFEQLRRLTKINPDVTKTQAARARARA